MAWGGLLLCLFCVARGYGTIVPASVANTQ